MAGRQAANDRPNASNYRPPVENGRPPDESHHPRMANYCPGASNNHPPAANDRPGASNHRPPAKNLLPDRNGDSFSSPLPQKMAYFKNLVKIPAKRNQSNLCSFILHINCSNLAL